MHAKRFGHIVVRAQFETHDLVDFFTLRGEEQNWTIDPSGPQFTTHIEPAQLGHHDVQHHEIERLLFQQSHRLRAVCHRCDLIAFAFQRGDQTATNIAVVFGQ